MTTKNAKAGEGVQLAEIIEEQSVKIFSQNTFKLNSSAFHVAAKSATARQTSTTTKTLATSCLETDIGEWKLSD